MVLGKQLCQHWQGFLRAVLFIPSEKNDVLSLARSIATCKEQVIAPVCRMTGHHGGHEY